MTPHISSRRWRTVALAVLCPFLTVLTVLTGTLLGAAPSAPAGASTTARSTTAWTPVLPSDFADPDVLLYGGTYYGYATQNFAAPSQTINVQTATSSDGTTWTLTGADALPTLPSWATPTAAFPYKNTWAPSVAYSSSLSQFVMYFTATDTSGDAETGDQCIGRATSPSPLGPFVSSSNSPTICQGELGGSIDPDIFTALNGTASLIWKSDGNRDNGSFVAPDTIWSLPLTPDLQLAGLTPTALLSADQQWQSGVVEGPDMVNIGGADYLFYAGNAEESAAYGIGYATCFGGPTVPCTDGSANPLASSAAGFSGAGGPSVFVTPADTLQMAFAAWSGTTIGYLDKGIRPMFMATLSFHGIVPALSPANGGGPVTNPATTAAGYWQVAADGGIFTFGSAQFYGSTGSLRLNKPVVGMAATPDGRGYWLVASDGGIFSFGDARFYGSTGSLRLNKPIIAMVPTADGHGYWLVASDGGIFSFGDASFEGSAAGLAPGYPITAMTPTSNGLGYWMVDANGQVFPFGNAVYAGQPSFAPGGYRITGMAATADNRGYWLISANGNVATFGDARSFGSPVTAGVVAPVVGISTTDDDNGYWLQGADGGIFSYGDATYEGSMGGHHLNAPMVGITSVGD
ncbi:MAG TPA: glycoside hydrolase family 43 protein [Acidimicrobiales bacterium]|jgi:hypothetical protein|nr:glycoside hydrolase family 43 protein [Acidimicrobiales bacterium]